MGDTALAAASGEAAGLAACAGVPTLSARAEAPAATPARPRKVCLRVWVWPKLRTKSSKRSESIDLPSSSWPSREGTPAPTRRTLHGPTLGRAREVRVYRRSYFAVGRPSTRLRLKW